MRLRSRAGLDRAVTSFGFFDPHSSEVVGEGQADRALEEFTKIKRARVKRFCDRGQTQRAVLILRYEMFRGDGDLNNAREGQSAGNKR